MRSAFCTAFGIEVTEYVYHAYHWDADPEIRKPELDGYIRHRLSLFEPTGFFSACREDVEYTQSQEYFNEFEFYENGICIRHR